MIKRLFPLTLLLSILTSCEEILLEEDISASEIQLLAPADNSVVEASTISFRWTEVEGATAYQLQIATPNFDLPRQILLDTEVEENFHTINLPKNNYEWRVRGLNSEYVTAFVFAKIRVKSNADFSLNNVILLSPDEAFITNKAEIKLKWAEVEGATQYRIQIVEAGLPIKEVTTLNNYVDIEFPQGEFKWRVRAENNTQNTFFSEREILVDTVAPNIPELTKPADKKTLLSGNVTFEWKRDPMEGAIETDSIFIYKDAALAELVEKDKVNTSYNTILEREEIYYWFMGSHDAAGNFSSRSEVFSFTVN